eukprot:1534455-Pyramimonas_sp.AAC.1
MQAMIEAIKEVEGKNASVDEVLMRDGRHEDLGRLIAARVHKEELLALAGLARNEQGQLTLAVDATSEGTGDASTQYRPPPRPSAPAPQEKSEESRRLGEMEKAMQSMAEAIEALT